MGDTAGGYLVGLRAGQGVCSEIDRSQSCIPISSIALCDTVHVGKMALADDIDLLVSRRPGLTELALAKFLFGRMQSLFVPDRRTIISSRARSKPPRFQLPPGNHNG